MKRPFASRVASGALRLLIKSLCTTSDNLEVDVDASSNLALLSGNLNGVSVTASRIDYNGFAISGGAALYTDEICITTRYPGAPLSTAPRLAKPFSVSIRASLTEADLNRPGPARGALEVLLHQIIATGLGGAVGRVLPQNIGGVNCTLERVHLVDPGSEQRRGIFNWGRKRARDVCGKIILRARAKLSNGKELQFAVRTGLTTIENGSIVKLSDPEFVWRNVTVPIVTIDMIGIRLDATAKLTKVEIDKGNLSGDGIMVISPPSDSSRRLHAAQRDKSRASQTSTRKHHAESRSLPLAS